MSDEVLDVMYPSFLLAIYDNELWLGKRKKDPGKGLFAAMGGKPVRSCLEGDPQLVEKPGGHLVESVADQFARLTGRELPINNAIREFGEEAFHNQYFDRNDFAKLYKMGFVVERFTETPGIEWQCYYILGNLNRGNFSPKPDEVSKIERLSNIPLDQIIPGTAIALEHLRWYHESGIMEVDENYKPFAHINFTDLLRGLPQHPCVYTGLVGAAHLSGENPKEADEHFWE